MKSRNDDTDENPCEPESVPGGGASGLPAEFGPSPFRARSVGELKSALDSMPDVRSRRIQRLKRRVVEGVYRVEADQVAERLMGEAAGDAIHRGKQGLDRWPPK